MFSFAVKFLKPQNNQMIVPNQSFSLSVRSNMHTFFPLCFFFFPFFFSLKISFLPDVQPSPPTAPKPVYHGLSFYLLCSGPNLSQTTKLHDPIINQHV